MCKERNHKKGQAFGLPAVNVGSRHGKPYVIKIDCQKMLADGCKFFLSNNGVWLTEKVLPEYFCE